jgi:CubicO group peptidase (beta-lactamase class C family)
MTVVTRLDAGILQSWGSRQPLRAFPAIGLLLLLAPIAGGPAVAQLPPDSVVRAQVDSLARAFVEGHQAPGLSIQVVRGRDTLVRAGYGLADVEQGVPASATTLYRIGSITKQFAAASVMRLSEERKVSLDDSIAAYLPSLPTAWRRVTVRQLLNHTSGIPSYTSVGERWTRRWREDMPPDTLVALSARDSVWFAPGSAWRYDNSGYVVLGMLLDRVTGEPFPGYVERRLLRPLRLEHTWYCDDQRVLPGRAPGYESDSTGWRHADFLSMTQPYSAGALCSTVGDLAYWNIQLATGHVVTPVSYGAMTTPEGAARAHRYGFGLAADTLGGHRMITHGGGIFGFASANAYFPADSLSVTVLTNAGSANPDYLLGNVARAALGLPLDHPPARVPLTLAERERYVGQYEIRRPGNAPDAVTVTNGPNSLTIRFFGIVGELIPYGHDTFGVPFDPALRFVFSGDGMRASGFTVVAGGQTLQGLRVGDVR